MPQYTQDFDFSVTLENDIREGQPNPFFDAYKNDPGFVDGVGEWGYEVVRSLDVPENLADGKERNYREQFYKNLHSAQTTAGHTGMKQHTFVTKWGVIYGWQI